MTININSEIVEHLESTHDRVRYVAPCFTHHDKLKEYIEALEHEEAENRENKVHEWVNYVLQTVLEVWKDKYSQNTQLIDGARKERLSLEKSRKQLETLKEESMEKAVDLKKETENLENEIHELEKKSVVNVKYNLASLKLTVIILLIFSILIAIGTYVYFLQSQSNLYWATSDNATKMSDIKNFIRGGEENFVSAFEESVKEDRPTHGESKEEFKKNLSLYYDKVANEVNLENSIRNAPAITTLQYLQINPMGYIMGFSAFLLILGGKTIAMVYEKINYPNWMFFSMSGLALILIVSLTYNIASIQTKTLELKNISSERDGIQAKINKIEVKEKIDAGLGFGDDEVTLDQKNVNPEKIEYQTSIAEKTKEYNELQKTFSSDKMLSYLLFLLTEVVAGSLTWMKHSDYIVKKQESESGFDGHIIVLKKKMVENTDRINSIMQEKICAENEIVKATDLIHRLDAMLSDLPSKEKINQFAKNFMDTELMYAKQVLQQKIHSWR